MKTIIHPYTKQYPSDFEALNAVEAELIYIQEECGFTLNLIDNVLVSVSEALNNAIYHAHKNNSALNIEVGYEVTDASLIISVKDQGNGFDFENIPDPTAPENINKLNGRGIFLIKTLSDKVQYNLPDRRISMSFQLS